MTTSPGAAARLAALALAALAARPAAAEPSRLVELEGLATWLEGDAQEAAITEAGGLVLPPVVRALWQDPAAQVTAATALGDGLILALADGGQLVRLAADGTRSPLCRLEVGAVTALAGRGDEVFAASIAPTRLWRIATRGPRAGVAVAVYTPAAKFIWDLVAGPNQTWLLATGDPGGIVEVDGRGRARELAAPPDAHLRSLAFHPRRGLFIGSGERGVLYQTEMDGGELAQGPPRALFDSGLSEIVAVTVDDHATYLAAVSGAAAAAQAAADAPAPEVRAQVVRVDDHGSATMLAGSTDEVVGALAWDGAGRLLVATGTVGGPAPHGRLYGIDPTLRSVAMLSQSPSRRLTHLVAQGRQATYTVAAGGARVDRLEPRLAREGAFVTAPFDAGLIAQVGAIEAWGSWPAGTAGSLSARTGQSARPDAGWSPWSAAQPATRAAAPKVPRGRFVQLRLALTGDGRRSPEVRQLRLALRRQNVAPFVREVMVLRRNVALLPLPREDQKGRLVTFGERPASPSEDGREELRRGPGGPVRARQVPERGAQAVRWAAEDLNGDELRYTLMLRRLEEDRWYTLADGLQEPYYTLRTSSLADGRYVFRVRACDAPGNAAGEALCAHADSRAVAVDGTPPTIAAIAVHTEAGGATLRTEVEDALGPLAELSWALDYGPPRPLLPDDGVLDGPRESVTLRLTGLAPGRHVVTVRAVDAHDNEALAEARFEVAGGGR